MSGNKYRYHFVWQSKCVKIVFGTIVLIVLLIVYKRVFLRWGCVVHYHPTGETDTNCNHYLTSLIEYKKAHVSPRYHFFLLFFQFSTWKEMKWKMKTKDRTCVSRSMRSVCRRVSSLTHIHAKISFSFYHRWNTTNCCLSLSIVIVFFFFLLLFSSSCWTTVSSSWEYVCI